MSASSEPASQAVATALLGPVFIGWMAAFILFGIFLACFTSYVSSDQYGKDGAYVKGVMWSILVLGLINTGINGEQMFQNAVLQARDVNSILSGSFASNFQPMLIGMISMIVQSFLLIRASKVFANRAAKVVFLVSIGLLITMSFAGSLMTAGLGWMYYNDTIDNALPLTFNQAVGVWLWCAMGVDVSISLALYFNLRQRMVGFNHSTDTMLQMLIKVALKTASYTAIVSIGGAVVSVAFKEDDLMTTNVPYAFLLPVASLYSISLFTTLHSRTAIAKKSSEGYVASGQGTTNLELSTVTARRESLAPNGSVPMKVHVNRIAVRLEEREEDPEKMWRGSRETQV